jgi:hypothetical protein
MPMTTGTPARPPTSRPSTCSLLLSREAPPNGGASRASASTAPLRVERSPPQLPAPFRSASW